MAGEGSTERRKRPQWHCPNDVKNRKDKREREGRSKGENERERQIKIQRERAREREKASGNVLMMEWLSEHLLQRPNDPVRTAQLLIQLLHRTTF